MTFLDPLSGPVGIMLDHIFTKGAALLKRTVENRLHSSVQNAIYLLFH